jgi:hypothetical protein
MTKRFKLDFSGTGRFRQQRGSALLGLQFEAGRLDGVALRRTNGSVALQKAFSIPLALDPLTNAPELVGREIRNGLEAEGLRERRCVVGLPLKWVLITHTKIPELSEADRQSFLQIEAERGFPCDVSTLITGTSFYTTSGGDQWATFVGVPRNHIVLLEAVLRAAQLRPVSFGLGLTALQAPEVEDSSAVLALALGETSVGLQVTAGGGIAALRTLEGALEVENGHRRLHADVVAREMRITLAQMPADLRQAIRRVRVFGPRDLAQQMADEIELRLEPMDFEVEVVTNYASREYGLQVPPEAPVSAAFSLAVRHLAGRGSGFEFLPPKISSWQRLAARYSTGKLQQASLAGALLAIGLGSVFAYQQWQIHRLQAQWNTMAAKVTELKAIQDRIVQFRPWNDNSLRDMTILRRLTEAFPEDGSVTAKILEIRGAGNVTCTGTARDHKALLQTVERLRASPEIPEVSLGPTRGTSPALQFTFTFAWKPGGKDGA